MNSTLKKGDRIERLQNWFGYTEPMRGYPNRGAKGTVLKVASYEIRAAFDTLPATSDRGWGMDADKVIKIAPEPKRNSL